MRHVVIVCLLLFFSLGTLIFQRESSIRINGGLGELASKTLRAHDVEIEEDGVFTVIDSAQKERLVRALCVTYKNLGRERDLVNNNLANAKTTKTASGEPYRRRVPVYDGDGHFQGVEEDLSDYYYAYNPSHPDAIREGPKTGYVAKPNVNPEVELAHLDRIERQRQVVQSIVERVDPQLIFLDEPLSQFPAEPDSVKKISDEHALVSQQSPSQQHFDLSLLPEPLASDDSGFKCVKQSNDVSCGQASVAAALNYLSHSELTDKDIDQHYGFQLLEALKDESPQGIEWRDAGNLTEETWPLIQVTLNIDELPVIVAFAGPADPTKRGYIVTLLKVEGDIVTYADPLTGTLKTITKKDLVNAPSHPDGNFIFLPRRVAVTAVNPHALMEKPMGPNGLL